jgi:hypothetical protein
MVSGGPMTHADSGGVACNGTSRPVLACRSGWGNWDGVLNQNTTPGFECNYTSGLSAPKCWMGNNALAVIDLIEISEGVCAWRMSVVVWIDGEFEEIGSSMHYWKYTGSTPLGTYTTDCPHWTPATLTVS